MPVNAKIHFIDTTCWRSGTGTNVFAFLFTFADLMPKSCTANAAIELIMVAMKPYPFTIFLNQQIVDNKSENGQNIVGRY